MLAHLSRQLDHLLLRILDLDSRFVQLRPHVPRGMLQLSILLLEVVIRSLELPNASLELGVIALQCGKGVLKIFVLDLVARQLLSNRGDFCLEGRILFRDGFYAGSEVGIVRGRGCRRGDDG